MNTIQKIFLMVICGSIVLFIVTIIGLGFDGYHYSSGASNIKYYFQKGVAGKDINWVGIISLFNIAVSVPGFFLFKDK